MLNVLDLWKSAQATAALETAGRQIGLTPDQARAAALALTPAFLMALQRNAFQSPASFADLMRLTGTGAFAPLMESGLSAFTPQRQTQAEDAAGRLFGPEVSRLVAAQTAAVAGIAPEAVRQMLPLVTGLMFGNLAASAAPGTLSRMAETARAAPANPPETALAQMIRPWLPKAQAPPAPEPNPWEDVFSAMFGLPPRPPPAPAPAPEPPPDPFGDLVRAMMGVPPPEPPAPEPPPPEPPAPEPADAWNEAFRAGEAAQRRHLEALQAIFDGAWRPQPDPAR